MAAVLCPRALASISTFSQSSVDGSRAHQASGGGAGGGVPSPAPPTLFELQQRAAAAPPGPAPVAVRAANGDAGAAVADLLSIDLDEGPDAKPVSEQLAAALRANATRVLDLFKAWDVDGNGQHT